MKRQSGSRLRRSTAAATALSLVGCGALWLPELAWAQEEAAVTAEQFTVNNLWIMIAASLVFIMHLGFASVESGLTRAKNTVNILFKNSFIVCLGLVSYAYVGFNLMYPDSFAVNLFGGGFLGFDGFAVAPGEGGLTTEYASGKYTYWTDFLFQAMFAATCATIVSGAVAERIKLSAFMLFSALFVTLVYPLLGSWKWGGGWLNELGFYDFAGSTLVHSVGGWGALVGAWMLGPRLGKYVKGKVSPIPGSSMPMATIGVFLLWLGWFGFNGGSVLSADPAAVSLVLVTTSLAAAAGGLAAMVMSNLYFGKPDLSMALNGILAGLVGITAGADQMAMGSSLLIGAIAGVIVVYSVVFFDRIQIDDPVGAISVHLTCGIWGTLAVGIFGQMASVSQLGVQALGVAVYAVCTLGASAACFAIAKVLLGLRVSPEEENEGLDLAEHGMHAYDGLGRIGASAIADELEIAARLGGAPSMASAVTRAATAEG